MRNQDPKAFPDPEDKGAKVDGFGKPGRGRSGFRSRPQRCPLEPLLDGAALSCGREQPRGSPGQRCLALPEFPSL